MKEKINCERARNISVTETLAKLGHFPIKESEKEAWFLSVLRSETQASFKVSKRLNRWFDYGAGYGGNIIDLIQRIKNCSVKEALEFLVNDISYFSFQQQEIFKNAAPKIQVLKVINIKHPALIQYLHTRKISLTTARRYCKEVWYQHEDKKYFAIGLQNEKGGWELRNKYFKNSNSPKSYTYLKKSTSQLLIVEGMFDLLSLTELNNESVINSDIIILNSIPFINTIEKYLNSYKKVHLYLDNDNAGIKATKYLMENHKHSIDYSYSYKNYKDLNELLYHGEKLRK